MKRKLIFIILFLSNITFTRAQDSSSFIPDNLEPITSENVNRLTQIASLVHPEGWSVSDIAFNPDGTSIATSRGFNIYLWDLATGTSELISSEESLPPDGGDVTTRVTFSPDGQHLVFSTLEEAVLWNVSQAAPEDTPVNLNRLREFSPNGTEVILRGDEQEECVFVADATGLAFPCSTLKLVDLRTGETTMEFPDYTGNDVVFSGDGGRVAYSSYRRVRIWDTVSGEQIAAYRVTTTDDYYAIFDTMENLAFSPDGDTVYTESKSFTISDDTQNRDILLGDFGVLNPDGSLILSNGIGASYPSQCVDTFYFQDVESHEIIAEFNVDTCTWLFAFSADGRLIAVADNEGVVQLWGVPQEE